MPGMDEAYRALETHFGYKEFRPGQKELIGAILSGRDVVAVMPTGAGKSLCYQIPAAVTEGLTIVVSPLISLMGDQVRSLKEAGIRGSYLNSSLNPRQQAIVLERALAGWYDLMYVAPERLQDPTFIAFARKAKIPLVAVDEAHCISEWGQDFRPAYRRIADFAQMLPERPVMAGFTATATAKVERDIVERLGLADPLVVHTGFDRPNLSFIVREATPAARLSYMGRLLAQHRRESGIIYCRTRKRTDEVAEALRREGWRCGSYHAGMAPDERLFAQQAFVSDDMPIIVATNAFGMGIDKSNVRFVINDGLPLTLEEYYQEAGRAGRDGKLHPALERRRHPPCPFPDRPDRTAGRSLGAGVPAADTGAGAASRRDDRLCAEHDLPEEADPALFRGCGRASRELRELLRLRAEARRASGCPHILLWQGREKRGL